ncbi:hypothetical protein PR002_g1788 [Phytophthora rubi]|uniref:SLC26A/SulP transporter domain-containing protein n=1 Tax=Phytophthora rubi TaxID=129364 RepID=A0A6A3NSH1_9STRA|nr:hypothetical protein PR002_g1788 [Phytophthora rubi]
MQSIALLPLILALSRPFSLSAMLLSAIGLLDIMGLVPPEDTVSLASGIVSSVPVTNVGKISTLSRDTSTVLL